MSHQIDFQTYLITTLTNLSTRALRKEPPDLHIAQNLNRIVASAEPISSGFWLRLSPLYEPFAPKLQLAVKELNDQLISGSDTPATFADYISQLVEKVSEPVAA